MPPAVLRALQAMGYEEPTPVQREAIPPAMAGRDLLVEAETGTGKTTAFGVPAVAVGSRGPGVRALVLVPTRELARQVAEEVRALGAGSPFRAVAVTGGVHAEKEERTIAGDVRCLVATPGRLEALAEERKVRLDRVELVVLDEADRMLDMGFLPEVERVLARVPEAKQTILASATLSRGVAELAARHLKQPVEVRAARRPMPTSLAHFRVNVFDGQKDAALVALLRQEAPERAIVFLRTRDRAARFAKLLKAAGVPADPLQGEMTHEQRRHVFDLFQRGVTRVLVATDLASRGLDVPEMELVVNADLPDEDEQYVHRAGRAARLGRPGKVVSFVLPDEKTRRQAMERAAGVEMQPYRLAFSDEDVPEAFRPAPPPPPRKAPARKAARGKTPGVKKGPRPPEHDLPPSRRKRG